MSDASAVSLPFAPVGAQLDDDGVTYRVWAPDHARVCVALGGKGRADRFLELERHDEGYFAGHDYRGAPGDLYRFLLDDDTLAPDPASRFQPLGARGPSQVIDAQSYTWQTQAWNRPPAKGRVLYELHVGAFTRRGTFRSAVDRLDHLVTLGVNTIQLMPVADFPGRWSWGYNAVAPFAPADCYGTPDDFRTFIDAAHGRGLAVVLDVVYNHLGLAGDLLALFSKRYFRPARACPGGRTFNFDGDDARSVRNFFVQNALCWLEEFHVDGLRLDATHCVEDTSEQHIFAEIAAAVQSRGGFVIADDERNSAQVVASRSAGGWGADAVSADDFHHSVRVALTGRTEAYGGSYQGSPDEWVDLLTHGWLYRGQDYAPWKAPRGEACQHLAPEKFIVFVSDHHHVERRMLGDRLHEGIAPDVYRAVSTVLLLSPYTPMLFMGQEWATSAPFHYFEDRSPDAAARVQPPESVVRHAIDTWPEEKAADPEMEETFRASKIKWSECARAPHAGVLALYQACLRLRRTEPVFQNPPRDRWSVKRLDGAVALRWTDEDGAWLLLVALHPLGAVPWTHDVFTIPPDDQSWQVVLDTNERRFGGALKNRSALDPSEDAYHFRSAGALLLHSV
jgi:maltooligosyltrehalose trehalohydrolase